MHPKLKCIVVEDRLSSNGPHIKDLNDMDFQFLLGAKPGDHTFMFDNFMKMDEFGMVQNLSVAANGSSPATQTQWAKYRGHPSILDSTLTQSAKMRVGWDHRPDHH